jgi:hypothetical protein
MFFEGESLPGLSQGIRSSYHPQQGVSVRVFLFI